MLFKTHELNNFASYLKDIYPNFTDTIDFYMQKIYTDNKSMHLYSEEIFVQSINLITGNSISFILFIDSLTEYIITNHIPTGYFPVQELINNLNLQNFSQMLNNVASAQDSNKSFNYKNDFIIIANIPFIRGAALVDGNHRLAHAALNHDKEIKCCFLPEEISYQFLDLSSKEFINLLKSLPAC